MLSDCYLHEFEDILLDFYVIDLSDEAIKKQLMSVKPKLLEVFATSHTK